MKLVRITIACLATAAISTPAAFAGLLEDAMMSYSSRKYNECLSKCQTLIASGQGSDQVHYYMGLSYQGTAQVNPARSEYTWVLRNSKNATLRYNSQVALANLERYSAHRSYEGNGNNFDRYSPPNVRAQQVAQSRQMAEAQAAAAAKSGGGGSA